MSKYSATIYVANKTGGEAYMQMSHMSKGKKATTGAWLVADGENAGPMYIDFDTTEDDYWYCSATVLDGYFAGIYASPGSLMTPTMKCDLSVSDSVNDVYNVFTEAKFTVNVVANVTNSKVSKKGNYAPLTNIFVLMLENHSFDHLFGFAPIAGLSRLIGDETNTVYSLLGPPVTYTVSTPAVDPMPVGPGHEFMDTVEQLGGQLGPREDYTQGTYPKIKNTGFAASYNEGGAAPDQVAYVMACCDAPTQIPVLFELAQNFAICDQWYSSMPGPTWPNRLFAMGASSVGLDDSPTNSQVFKWETISGLKYPNGSIFDRITDLTQNSDRWRIYADTQNQFNPDGVDYASGQFPIAGALDGIKLWDIESFWTFEEDVQGVYPYQFTWIEPNYGDASGDFSGGSSQHPTDSLTAGECLIAATYNALRSSALWPTSVLIVTYDEHGGFYDHEKPYIATPPGDNPDPSLSTNNFDFTQLGVRVPAVVISPRVKKGAIGHDEYSHASIVKMVLTHLGLGNLTATDLAANDPQDLLVLGEPRTDSPPYIKPPKAPKKPKTTDVAAVRPPDLRPLPDKGNIIGFLHIALKAEADMSDGSEASKRAILEKFKATVHTYEDARAYFERIAAEVEVRRSAQRASTAAASSGD
jgi:phospholipase C